MSFVRVYAATLENACAIWRSFITSKTENDSKLRQYAITPTQFESTETNSSTTLKSGEHVAEDGGSNAIP
jgi:hypothetical protein